MSVLGDLKKAWDSIAGNITGSRPVDPLGDVVASGALEPGHFATGGIGSHPSSTPSGNDTSAIKPWTAPKDAAGNEPESYVLWPQGPGYGDYTKGNPDVPSSLTTSEYKQWVEEARNGNERAKQLIRSYRPSYPQTAKQIEQGVTAPFAKSLESLSGDLAGTESQAQAAQPTMTQEDQNAAQIASQLSGMPATHFAPDELTQQLGNENQALTAPYQQEISQIGQQGLSELGQAAKESQATFPYESLIQDLLGRYAYTFESPYITPTAPQGLAMPDWLAQLFTTASAVGASGSLPASLTGTQPGTSGQAAKDLSNESNATLAQIASQIDPSQPSLGLQPIGGGVSNPGG